MYNEEYFITTALTTPTAVLTGGTLPVGPVVRRFDRRTKCGLRRFEVGSSSITAQVSGFYEGTALISFTAPAAGDATFVIQENGVAIPGATASETITTPTTEVRTVTIPFRFSVNKTWIGDITTALAKTISVVATGVGVTVTNFALSLNTVD